MEKNKLFKNSLLLLVITLILFCELSSQDSSQKVSKAQLFEIVKAWRHSGNINFLDSKYSSKCALGLTFEIIKQSQDYSSNEKKALSKLLEPPVRQKSRRLGNFTAHYDTVGYHTPSLLTPAFKRMLSDTNFVKTHEDSMNVIERYIDTTLYYFNYVWNNVVNINNYLPPPFEPGYSSYNLYITELGSGLYGQTVPSINPINPGQYPARYYTYIEIDNDFISVYPKSRGIAGLKVTAAHEFHHALQLGSYGYREYDRYFYEITSTWIEDLIFDDVNDYYQYIRTSNNLPRGHFATPDVSFIATDGLIEYSRAIFGKYLQERFSPSVIKNAWDIFKLQIPYRVASLYALNQALIQENSSLRLAFVEFAEWNYYTGERAKSFNTYKEAKNYPLIKSKTQLEILSSGRIIKDSLQNFSSLYQPIKYNDATSTVIINNINYDISLSGNINNYKFSLQFLTYGSSNDKQILPDLYASLKVNDPDNWNLSNTNLTITDEVYAFPNPFVIGSGGTIKFKVPEIISDVSLFVYNSDMQLVYKSYFQYSPYQDYIEWNAKDQNDKLVASGIYLFLLKTGEKEYVGKFGVVKK